MSGATYDAAELRRRIVVCFSSKELHALAADLGASDVAAHRGAGDAARELVRHFERAGTLPMLVQALRRARPLVEWPEPKPPEEEPELLPDDLLAEVPDAPGNEAEAEPPPSGAESARWAPPQARFPGTVEPSSRPPPAPRGLDARILVAIAALTVLAALIAFVAGRASSRDAAGTAATSAPSASAVAAATSARPRRADGPAVRVSDAVMRSVANVARACELRSPGEPTDVLRGALSRCGPSATPARVPTEPADVDAGAADAEAPAATPAARPPEPGPPAAGNAGGPCIADCDAQHRACKQKCGPEPKLATEYAEHQQCLSRCLVAGSKCRLDCK